MMSKFFGPLGLLSDRANNISGNQPWYTALLSVVEEHNSNENNDVAMLLEDKFVFIRPIPRVRVLTLRYPNSWDSPDSHDNLLAHLYFGSLNVRHLEETHWYINNYHRDDHTWLECLSVAWKYKKELLDDRNYWHEKGLLAIGKLANRLPQWVRWYATESYNYKLQFLVHILFSHLKPNFTDGERETNNVSAKIQCWFMLKTTGSKHLIKLFDIQKLSDIYFSDDQHPIRRYLNETHQGG